MINRLNSGEDLEKIIKGNQGYLQQFNQYDHQAIYPS